MLFDTSALAGATVTAATLSLWGLGKASALGASDLHIVSSNPALNTAISTSDYGTLGTTSFGSISNASFVATDSQYNVITLNASGIAAISTNGITKLGARFEWDRAASFTGTWAANQNTYYQFASADNASGTAHAPKLVVTFSPPLSVYVTNVVGHTAF